MKTAAIAIGMLAPLTACAAEGTTDECLKIHDSVRRLDCLDKVLQYKAPPPPPSPTSRPVLPFVRVHVRESGDFSNYGESTLGDDPALISAQRSGGNNATIAKVAAIASFRPVNDLGWQPFASTAWNRDTSGSTRKDTRSLGIGVMGPLWDPFEQGGWTLLPVLRATRRYDLYGTNDANTVSAHISVISLKWVNCVPSGPNTCFSFIPHFGFISENRTSAGITRGSWRSAYAGFKATAQLNGVLPRLSSTLNYQRFADSTAPFNNVKRHAGYTRLSLDYALTDPADKSIAFRPSIFIRREVGSDILNGGDRVNKTVLGLGIQYN
ncbi:hypothetical protein EJP67_10690 [Variovorax guangxiensis]|uniref:Transporter n=1 Tax=Variovorax guangxiensis TaxID=1775474 RepID=A0A433MHJ1_9BURK|nr:hypothetical protein [Variovorax guangxiensis]RUR67521.1 hypothetical protein EJP67_10690 [Variovorax guangxiensis]